MSDMIPAIAQECCELHLGICGDKCCDDSPIPVNCGKIQIIKLPPRSAPKIPTLKEKTSSPEDVSLEPPPKWVYVWHDPLTKTRYLSNTFPPWYRNIPPYPEDSPRVIVYDEYNRIIDDTKEKLSAPLKQTRRKQAKLNQQQHQAYQKAKQEQEEKGVKQTRLEILLQQWLQNQKLPVDIKTEMMKLLDYFAMMGEVKLGMTEEQVQKAWGEQPKSMKIDNINNKIQKTLKYQQGQVILVDNVVKSFETK